MRCVLWLALAPSLALAVECPNTTGNPYAAEVANIQRQPSTAASPDGNTPRSIEIGNLLKIDASASCFVQFVLLQQTLSDRAKLFVQSFKDLEAVRTDKQAGSSNSAGGTTNLVSGGLTAQVLSMAAEYGALTESASNQTVTVQGSLDGIVAAAIQQDLIGYCPDGVRSPDPFCVKQPLYSWLRRFSYGVSFNASQPSQTVSGIALSPPQQSSVEPSPAQPITFTASGREISSITARIILLNQRDATSKKFQNTWTKQIASSPPRSAAANSLLSQLQALLGSSFDKVKTQDGYTDWYNASFEKLREDAAAEPFDAATFTKDLDDSVKILYALVLKADPALPQQSADFLRSSEAYAFTEQAFIESIANTPVLTVEFDDNRPQNQSSYSAIRLIYDKPLSRKLSLIANGALEVSDTQPPGSVPGASRFRDAQLGVQLKYSLNSKGSKNFGGFLGSAALSGTYYFQYQHSPTVLNVTPGTPLTGITLVNLPSSAAQVFAQNGNIHIGQLRLELGPAGSSVRFPIALTYSNRTELITKPELRAQIGISYDFDALFANANSTK